MLIPEQGLPHHLDAALKFRQYRGIDTVTAEFRQMMFPRGADDDS